MQIQLNTDHNIAGRKGLATEVSNVVEGVLEHFSDRITRVEVHLSDQHGDKSVGPHDIRCVMEARLAGRQPIAVTHQTTTVNEAIGGAAEKLARLIEHTLGRLRDHRESPPSPATVEVDDDDDDDE